LGGSGGWSEEGVVVVSKSTPAAELAAALYQGREAWNAPLTYTLEDVGENLVAAMTVATGRTIYDSYDPLLALKPMEAEEGFDVGGLGLTWNVTSPASVHGFEM
jgi:hypothetical protein